MSDPPKQNRRAAVCQRKQLAGYLEENPDRKGWIFEYVPAYSGHPVSLTLPVRMTPYPFDAFPAVFEGLLPEGAQLEALLKIHKIDRGDFFRQLVTVGRDLVGSLSVIDATDSATSGATILS